MRTREKAALDGAGMCTVQHALGADPAVVVVSANTPGQWFSFAAYGGPISQPTTSRLFPPPGT
ncbi:hypothetical protein DMH01_11970 [Amycolatopsis sp. WAC 04182]|uniref:hypothetical protein n=1 Tax=Amycolatopsis sp. WAC 04182 TaxID=2203198 RepID=UPI000F7A8257|nr:hypothetical protein [Amycolatopsis sp. WAC 04182]RSN63298.1 hypothetical protein DMH01_11970 [Amycolatopsis sp. WAC 04182]